MADGRRIVHVEVGGSYGGSLRVLEVYLSHADHSHFRHDILFYYPTSAIVRIPTDVCKQFTLRRSIPRWLMRPRANMAWDKLPQAGHGDRRRVVSDIKAWLVAAVSALPTVVPLVRALVAGRYDVVHVNNTFTYQAPTIAAAVLAGLPIVGEVRSPLVSDTLSLALIRRIDTIVTVIPGLIPDALRQCTRGRVVTCFGGLEVEAGRPDMGMRAAILSGRGLLVGSAGRLVPEKGYDVFLMAARRVIERWAATEAPVGFVIAGEGPCRPGLQSLIDELGLNGIVHLWGFRSDISNFLSSLDLFVCSSLWEGGPLTVIEAALLEVPVVSTAVGVVPELSADGGVLAAVPPGDPVALADAILEALRWRIFADPGEVRRRLQLARRVAGDLVDPVKNARCLDEVFASVLARRHNARVEIGK